MGKCNRLPAEHHSSIVAVPICYKNKWNWHASTVENKILQKKALRIEPVTEIKINKYINNKRNKKVITGATRTKLRRKEFALRNEEMKLMNDGCCSSLHLLLIIQTPAQPSIIK